MTDAPRVLALVGDENGCSLWRVWQPFAELSRRGHIAEWCFLDDTPKVFGQVAAGVYNAVVLPRLFWRDSVVGRRWIDRLHAAGLAVIYEVDDDLFSPQIVDRQRATTEPDTSPEQLERDRRDRIVAARCCDGVIVSSPTLARVVEQYVDAPVCVVPNSIDVRWWRSSLRSVRRGVPPLTIGWSGGARYREDLEPVAEAWANIARRFPDVTFVVQGHIPEAFVGTVPLGRVCILPWVFVEPRGNGLASDYPAAMVNIDIGCAAVAPTHFNACKTPIKAWEYTLAGAATVCSPTLYGDVIVDGQTGLIAETAAEWEAAIARLITDVPLRKNLRRAQRRVIAERYSLERNAHRWLEAWSTILQEFERSRPRILIAS